MGVDCSECWCWFWCVAGADAGVGADADIGRDVDVCGVGGGGGVAGDRIAWCLLAPRLPLKTPRFIFRQRFGLGNTVILPTPNPPALPQATAPHPIISSRHLSALVAARVVRTCVCFVRLFVFCLLVFLYRFICVHFILFHFGSFPFG